MGVEQPLPRRLQASTGSELDTLLVICLHYDMRLINLHGVLIDRYDELMFKNNQIYPRKLAQN